jgi:two-component system, chemotaxis family, sensor kinase CheA
VDMSKYRELFISESMEHLHSMNELIVCLEKENGDRERIDSLFRAAHSIKGMAASMGYGGIAELAHSLEDLMARVRKDSLVFDAGVADLLLEGADSLESMILDVAQGAGGDRDMADLMERISGYDPSLAVAPAVPPLSVDPAGTPPAVTKESGQGARHKPGEPGQTVRVKTEILDHLINTTGELITNKHRLLTIGSEIGSVRLDEALTELAKLLRELYNGVINVRMMPFATVSDRFPRMVRDLAKKSGKDVAFVVEGDNIELDRGILEELADPLIHIIRNAIDHGLEGGEERLASGKPAEGMVRLSVSREKDRIVICVEDDGRGMDPAKLLASAIEKGFLDPGKAAELTTREALLLVCIPGFSTAREVSDVSGRGVGMDAVNSTIQSLAGSLAIESKPGRGSRMILKLPLTITIINVLLAKVSPFSVAIPVTNILHTMELRSGLIATYENQKVFYMGEETVPIVSLQRIFSEQPALPAGEYVSLLITEIKGRKVGLAVDSFLGQQEVFVKPLGRPLARLRGLAGGAILGDGEIVFVLDVASLL